METLGAEVPARRRVVRYLARAAAVVLVVIAIDFAWFTGRVWGYFRASERSEANLPSVTPDEAIVVLTGAEQRIPAAVELLRRRHSAWLIISGTGRGTTLTDLANEQGDAIFNIQEVWNRVVIDPRAGSTVENALETGKILKDKRIRRVILITSDFHMPRSALAFETLLPGYEYYWFPVSSLQFNVISAARMWGEYIKYALFRSTTWLPSALPAGEI